jgi:hypothetical protein
LSLLYPDRYQLTISDQIDQFVVVLEIELFSTATSQL